MDIKKSHESDFYFFLKTISMLKRLRIPLTETFLFYDKKPVISIKQEKTGEIISEHLKETFNNWDLTQFYSKIKFENYRKNFDEIRIQIKEEK